MIEKMYEQKWIGLWAMKRSDLRSTSTICVLQYKNIFFHVASVFEAEVSIVQ